MNVNHARARPSVLPHLAYGVISWNAVLITMMMIGTALEEEGVIPREMQQGLAAFFSLVIGLPWLMLLVATIGIVIALTARAPRHALRIFLLVGACIAVGAVMSESGGSFRFKVWLGVGISVVVTTVPIVWLAQAFRSEPIEGFRWLAALPLVSSAVCAAVAAAAGGALVYALTQLPVMTVVYAVFFGLLGGSVPIVVAGGRVLPEGGRRNPVEE